MVKSASGETFKHIVIVGAAGSVGRFLIDLLKDPDVDLCGFDLIPSEGVIVADVLEPSVQLDDTLLRADLVLLALDDATLYQAAPKLLRRLRKDCLLVDTGSIKTDYCLNSATIGAAEILSINPLFGPDIARRGRSIAAVSVRTGYLTQLFCNILKNHGFNLIMMSAEEHDKAAAVAQALSHAILISFLSAERVSENANQLQFPTPPFRILRAMAGRLLSANPQMIWSIQSENPHSAMARERFLAAFTRLDEVVKSCSYDRFVADWLDIVGSMEHGTSALELEAKQLFMSQQLIPD